MNLFISKVKFIFIKKVREHFLHKYILEQEGNLILNFFENKNWDKKL